MQGNTVREGRQQFLRQSPAISEREVNTFICRIQPRHNKTKQYQQMLAIWNQSQPAYNNQVKEANIILALKPRKQASSYDSNLCQVCYDQLNRKRTWCRICGNMCCAKCVARLRVVPGQAEPVEFCDKCDRQYMVAMIIRDEHEKVLLRQKAFQKLADEQNMLESLLKIERQKVDGSKEGEQPSDLLIKMNQITEITSKIQFTKAEITETRRKIEWGQQIHGQLRKKLRRLRKKQSESFASSAQQDHEGWAPPKADGEDYVSVENLNESFIKSIIETENKTELKPAKSCNCVIF